jgi:F0F1-type ATP synthase, gamma subunit
MANEKEIRTKIGSVKNTQKITKAMEMVAASKMRRTQVTMKKALPYADKIRDKIGHIYKVNPEYKQTDLEKCEVKTAGYIVVSSDMRA